MIDPKAYLEILRENCINFYTGIPDSLLKDFCACVTDSVDGNNHIIAANEGAAIALAMGHYVGSGNIPFVYMQNSGLGNCVNPLLSLASPEVYATPLLLMIGWRGEPGVKDEPQHVHQGRITLDMLETMGIEAKVLSNDPKIANEQTISAIKRAKSLSSPIALVVKKGTFSSYTSKKSAMKFNLSREQAIICAASSLEGDAAIVATTGMASRELFEYRANNKLGHSKDFLTVGGMGHASQIALGLALAKPDRRIYCFDGDGATIMHMGSLGIIGSSGCKNFVHIVFNNGCHGSVGGQPTIAFDIDLCSIADACGYSEVKKVCTLTEIQSAIASFNEVNGPSFIEICTSSDNRKDIGRPTSSPVENKFDLMKFLGVVK